MNQYTIKSSKPKKVLSDILDSISSGLLLSYKVFLFLARATRRIRQYVEVRSIKLYQSSKGVTFTIIKVVLQDRYSMRVTLMDVSNGKKYFCYHRGNYTEQYKALKGSDLEVIDQHYLMCAALDWYEC